MKLLLIADGPTQAAILRQVMEQNGLCGEIRRMRQGKSAISCATQSGRYSKSEQPDFIMLDFSAPDEGCVTTVKQIAFGPAPAVAPVVLLVTPDSRDLLDAADLATARSKMFAPTSLFCFVRKMKQHSRSRFLRALSVMSDLGPILVSLPTSYMRRADEHLSLPT